MIQPSRALSKSANPSAAVCIVGAGAAGITLACELDGAGFSVILLEASGVGRFERVSQDPYEGEANEPHPSPANFRRRAFGGSTTIWGGRCVPYDPIDFERRDYAPNSGWPISYYEVARYYQQAVSYCDAGNSDFAVETALEHPKPTIPGLTGSDLDTSVIERYSLPTDFGARYRERLAQSANVRVVTQAHVLRLVKEEGADRIAAVDYVDRAGRAARIEATAFVLATGGIETPRLLLASDPAGKGYGNHSDCLGRYYTCHVENILGVLRPKRPSIPFDFERTRDGVYGRRKLQIRPEAQRREGILNIAFRLHYPDVSDPNHGSPVLSAVYLAKRTLIPEYRRILQHGGAGGIGRTGVLHHLGNVVGGLSALAGFGVDYLRRRVLAKRKLPYVLVPNANGTYPIEFNSEQTPLPNSRITLNGAKDQYGVPRVHVDWRMCGTDVDSICRAYRLLRDGLARSGACELDYDEASLRERVAYSMPVGGHHIGATRMAATPAGGVVDKDCAVFGLPNLYVASSSVFPTSGHANPTLTIVALSIRLARHLRTQLGGAANG